MRRAVLVAGLVIALIAVAATLLAWHHKAYPTKTVRPSPLQTSPATTPHPTTSSPTATRAYRVSASSPQPATSRGKVVEVVDLAGRHVKVRVPVKRVVITFHGYIVALDAIGGSKALHAIVGADVANWRREHSWLYEKYVERFPWLRNVSDIGTPEKLNVTRIIALKPDVVIAPLYTRDRIASAVERLERSGIPVIFIDFRSESLENYKKSVELLGKLFGEEKRAEELVKWYEEKLNLIQSRLRDLTRKPRVYVESGLREWLACGSNCSWSTIVRRVGGVNIADERVKGWGRIDSNYVAACNPDVIIIVGSHPTSGAGVVSVGYYANSSLLQREMRAWIGRSELEDVAAIKHSRVYAIDDLLAGNVWDAVAFEFIAKALYPARFKDVDPVKDLEEFHEKFLTVSFTGTWMERLAPLRRTITIVDVLGRKVTVKVPVERAVILYGLEDWVAVGGEDALARVVALNSWRYRKWRPDWWAAWIEHYPWLGKLPDTGQPGINFKVEVVLKVKPDVVVTTPWMYQHMVESGDIKRLEQAGIPVVVIDFVPPTSNIKKHLETVEKSIKILGVLLGYEDRAESLAKFYEEQIMTVVERTANIAEKPKVLVLATWSPWRTYGRKGMYNVWITLAGGLNIGALAIPGSSGNLNPEFILKENPDVIVFTCNNNFPEGQRVVIGYTVNSTKPAKEALEKLIQRPGWNMLKAVREKRVYLIHHGLSHGHVFQFVCLQYLAKWIHPELFRDLNPAANLKKFYEEFMPFQLKGVWAVSLADP